jgi:hypothetical protein
MASPATDHGTSAMHWLCRHQLTLLDDRQARHVK